MKRTFFLTLFLFSISMLQAIYVGNGSEPNLLNNGLFTEKKKNLSFRAGYLQNYIYKGRYRDKFKNLLSTPSDTNMLILAGSFSVNLYNRVDLNAILGSTDFQLDKMIYADREFCYSLGLKAILYKEKDYDISLDGKYFSTIAKPDYFVVANDEIGSDIYKIIGSFEQEYYEYQLALLFSYKTNLLIPYIGATFLFSEIKPTPKIGTIFIPEIGNYPFETNDSKTRKLYGMVIGTSIINNKTQGNLTLEARMFDQNAVSVAGIFRF